MEMEMEICPVGLLCVQGSEAPRTETFDPKPGLQGLALAF